MMYEFSSVTKMFVLEKKRNGFKFNYLFDYVTKFERNVWDDLIKDFFLISWKYQSKEILYVQNVEFNYMFHSPVGLRTGVIMWVSLWHS